MTARFLVGDVFDRLAEIPDGTVDLVLTSPPFLALRSYLPVDHPNKAKEIGSEATPADFLDTLLELTAEWGRVLAPHGSIAVELGDTYAGSGGAGGDYNPGGLRDGQPKFRQADGDGGKPQTRGTGGPLNRGGGMVPLNASPGWPLDKSLCHIPELYSASLAYGRNLLTGRPSPAGMWRVRNRKPWIRSNPPVGALGDKERPATSYVVVACRVRDRYFDLDAVRSDASGYERPNGAARATAPGQKPRACLDTTNPAGAPPRDWWYQVDAVLDAVLDDMAGKPSKRDDVGAKRRATLEGGEIGPYDGGPVGARGVHLRRALEAAGILTTLEALDVSPKGYAGAHYAVWPPELCRLLIDEMSPRRVCRVCGEPSRRITESDYVQTQATSNPSARGLTPGVHAPGADPSFTQGRANRVVTTLGWSDCGHGGDWRPGLVLDPFVGSGTTLAVASGMGRDSIGIDIDESNVNLAIERVGMFLEVDYRRTGTPA